MSETTPEPIVAQQNKRLALGAAVLRNQVTTMFPGTESEGSGEPDGFNITRSIWFAGDAAKFLEKALPHLEDSRIESFQKIKGSKIEVTFVSTTEADGVADFPLEAAGVVGGEPVKEKSDADGVTEVEAKRIEAQSVAPVISGEPVTPTGDTAK